MTKDDLVLFLETSLDLNDEIFIDDLEQFPDDDDENDDLLIETNKIIENIDENTSQISGQDDYDWDPEDLVNLDDN